VADMTSMTVATETRVLDRRAAVAKPTSHTEANRVKLALLDRVLKDQLSTVLTTGYNGTTVIEIAINDGTIQHLRHRVERMER
jgi:hypothetical protein